ncbi:MAG: hypothetical protein IKI18_04495 [Prevotella sp.]|nr:hypothetical protein [Prevotella sp.]
MATKKKNESKPKQVAAVAPDAPATEQETTVELATAENQEPAPEAASKVKEDDPTNVPVSLLVFQTAQNGHLLRYVLRSVARNLCGVDCELRVVGTEKPEWLREESWLQAEGEGIEVVKNAIAAVETERVVLMTDRMVLLRPVLLSDIEVLKAAPLGHKPTPTMEWLIAQQGTTKHQVFDFDTLMPVLVWKKQVLALIETLPAEAKDLDIATIYFNFLMAGMLPIFIDWRTDGWLLPLVSDNPNMERVHQLLDKKKFLHVARNSESDGVMQLLKFRLPDPLSCEIEEKDAVQLAD